MRFVILFLVILFACPAWSEEFSVLGGWIRENSPTGDTSTLWQLEYREDLGEHLAFSVTYVNEGHFPNHHRDGHGVQLWAQTHMLDGKLTLSAGAGPYLFYDTTDAGPFRLNEHGWGALASLSATWKTECPLLFELRANWIETESNLDTLSATFGVGYGFDCPGTPTCTPGTSSTPKQAGNNEITLSIGETSVHNRGPAHSLASGIEYRRSILRHLEWTASWLYEGESESSRRTGLATQIWAAKTLLADRLSLGFGAGPYLAVERLRAPDNDKSGDMVLSGIVTMTAGYRFHPEWGVRASWNRVITNYSRDSDVWLAGISYVF